MHALRTRAACMARRTQPTTLRTLRLYSSKHDDHSDSHAEKHDHGHDHSHDHGHHDHHHHEAHNVSEGLGTAFYVFIAAIPSAYLGYSVSRPGPNGEESSGSKWLRSFDYFNDWEVRNALRTAAIEQAAHDRHLFYYSGKNNHVELKMPELMYGGSPYNIVAGQTPDLSHVTEHYRIQAAKEEERKFKRMQEKQQELEERQRQEELARQQELEERLKEQDS